MKRINENTINTGKMINRSSYLLNQNVQDTETALLKYISLNLAQSKRQSCMIISIFGSPAQQVSLLKF